MHQPSSNSELQRILQQTRTIATVGVSNNPIRPSYFVARYLHYRGFAIEPVNPAYAGQLLFGKTIHASISDIPNSVTVDMVDIFRRAEFVPDIVDEALLHLRPGLKTIWMQFGIYHSTAAKLARSQGLNVVENRCPKIEYQRLFGELRKAGINTGIISSRLPENMA